MSLPKRLKAIRRAWVRGTPPYPTGAPTRDDECAPEVVPDVHVLMGLAAVCLTLLPLSS